MTSTEDQLEELHVVSDLHLGGVQGHQIFNQGRALAAFIDHLGGVAARGRRVGLVLNGDIVDFLADKDATYFDPLGAADKLRAIFEDDAFRPVWDALERFTWIEGCVLALVLGNHDVELALPDVREALLARLCGGDEGARGRVRIAMDDEDGYACEVGGQRVLCLHGNQVDPWNPIDFRALREVSGALASGKKPPAWEPNAGTRLVVDVMNGVKMDFAFVDLLKPETRAVPFVLLALKVEHSVSLAKFARAVVQSLYDQGRLAAGFLGGTPVEELTDARALELLVRPSTWEQPAARSAAGWTGLDWLSQATRDDEDRRRPIDLVDAGAGETLGVGGLLLDRLRGGDTRENLRDALESYLGRDRSFRFDTEDDTFRRIDESRRAANADCVIAGHTHLARRLLRRSGRGVYFNSGTWIRLIELTKPMLTPDGFRPIYEALCAGTLEALDDVPGLVQQRRTVVSVWVDEENAVHGELRSAAGAPGGPPWVSVEGTQYRFPPRGGARRSPQREPAKEETPS